MHNAELFLSRFFRVQNKCMSFSLEIFFVFEYKCLHLLLKMKCIFEFYKCMLGDTVGLKNIKQFLRVVG